jgi:hypothetical protein
MGTRNSRQYYKFEGSDSKELRKISGSKVHGEFDTARICTGFLHLLGFSNGSP